MGGSLLPSRQHPFLMLCLIVPLATVTSFYFRLHLLKKGEVQDEWFVQSVAMIDSSSAVLGEGVDGGTPGWFFVYLH